MEDTRNQKIFDDICNLIATTEFIDAQLAFYKAHCGSFTDDEENKLEYMEIYKDFLGIIDTHIQYKLAADNDIKETEQDAFFLHFKDNFKKYQAQNPDVVETLFTCIDFEKFKKMMVDCKKGNMHAPEDLIQEQLPPHGFDFDKEFWGHFNEDYTNKASGWIKKVAVVDKKLDYEATVYQKKQKDSKSDLCRMDIRMPVHPDEIVKLWFDPPAEVNEMVKNAKVLKRVGEDYVVKYWLCQIPLINDRDVIFELKKKKHEGGWLMFSNSIPWEEIPVPKKVVRMNIRDAVFARPDPKDPRYSIQTEIFSFGMGGNIPASLENMSVASQSVAEFKNFYKLLPK